MLSVWSSLKFCCSEELTLYHTNDNILNRTKFKAFADDKLNVAKIMISVFDRVENIVGKGENAGFLFHTMFL